MGAAPHSEPSARVTWGAIVTESFTGTWTAQVTSLRALPFAASVMIDNVRRDFRLGGDRQRRRIGIDIRNRREYHCSSPKESQGMACSSWDRKNENPILPKSSDSFLCDLGNGCHGLCATGA
jgi:hypothetical protein